MRPLLALLISTLLPLGILSGNVLFMPSTLYPVHAYTMSHLANELSSRGHHVTWIEIGAQKSRVVLEKAVTREFWPAHFGDRVLNDIYVHRNHSNHHKLWDGDFMNENEQTSGWLASIRQCHSILSRNKPKFDKLVAQQFNTLVIDDLYNPCAILLAGLKKTPFVYWSMTSMRTESAWANQSPSPPSYLPVAGTGLTDDLTLPQRLYNVAAYFRQLYLHQHIVQPRIDAIFQKYYPGVESVFEIERNASINFVNNPPIFDFARPYMPRVNFVGGLHCKNASSLPTELERFVESNEKGFVVLSTGFTAQWKNAPLHVKTIFVETFRSLSTLNFVWQYDGPKIEELPRNVLAMEWLPLQNLLGHSKCVAHVTHGGLNSVIESVWHGVPIVGIPLTSRGYDNILRVSARDAGILIEKQELTPSSLTSGIRQVIENAKYKEEMAIFQDMVIDVPYTELYHASFWVEFIERHNEVPHARSGADKLNVLQYFLVDVIAFFFFVFYMIVLVAVTLVRSIYRIKTMLIPNRKHEAKKNR